jgi:MFS family permease
VRAEIERADVSYPAARRAGANENSIASECHGAPFSLRCTRGLLMTEMRAIPMPGIIAGGSAEPWPDTRRSWYAVIIFALTVMTLFGNQFMTGLLVGPIKGDLQLTDTQVALILGFFGGLINAVASLPISRLIDRFNRKLIIGFGLVIAGLSSAASGCSSTSGQLLIARLTGGLGGAGNGPATFSMLGDLFPPAKLPKALSAMNIGFSTGLALSMIFGGTLFFAIKDLPSITLPLIGDVHPWQLVFLILAVPDTMLGLIIWLTLREPKRRGLGIVAQPSSAPAAAKAPESLPLSQVFGYWWENRAAFGPMYLGLACNCVAFGSAFWMAEFYRRTFQWGQDKYGILQGVVLLVLTPLFLLFGGWLAEYYAKHGRDDANLRVTMFSTIAHIPFAVLFGLVGNPYVALALSVLNSCVVLVGSGPQNAAFQSIVPNRMRAQITASFLFVFTVCVAFGPVLVGWITDFAFHDDSKLRYSLVLTHLVLGPLAAWFFWKGQKPYAAAFARARAWH